MSLSKLEEIPPQGNCPIGAVAVEFSSESNRHLVPAKTTPKGLFSGNGWLLRHPTA